MKHADYVAQQMRDPTYRFWHYVYAPRFWIASKLLRLRFRLRSAVYRVLTWLCWECAEWSDHLALPYEHRAPTLRAMWRDWRGLRGDLSARLDLEYRR